MTVSAQLREAIERSGLTNYRISAETGLNIRTIDRFVAGEFNTKASAVDALCEYFGLELCRKKERTARKQSTNKPAKVKKGQSG